MHISGIERYPFNRVEIYNRWEVKVFEIDSYGNDNEWDGTPNVLTNIILGDGQVPEGTYYYIIDLGEGSADRPTETYLKKIDDTTFEGYRFSSGWARDQREYFTLVISKPVKDFILYDGGNKHDTDELKGEFVKGFLEFETKKNEEPVVEAKESAAVVPEPEPQQATQAEVSQAAENASPQESSLPSSDDDPDVVRSEINDIRKSVVSMSVGQPDRTTTIVKEWLEQPEPTPPAEPEQEAAEDPADGSDSEEKEK